MRKSIVVFVLTAAFMLLTGCPPNGASTFPYYIANLSTVSITELKMPHSETLVMTDVLTSDVPPNTMRIINLSRADFGESLSVVDYSTSDGAGGSINARLDNGPGEVGFRLEEVNAQKNDGLFIVDDDSKTLAQATAAHE